MALLVDTVESGTDKPIVVGNISNGETTVRANQSTRMVAVKSVRTAPCRTSPSKPDRFLNQSSVRL